MYVGKVPQIANGAVELPGSAGRRRGVLRLFGLVPGLALLLLLGACERAAAPGQSPSRPASPAAYPDLADVPPRPKLSETLEQRSEMGNQLAADRENASRRAAELAYAAGRAAAPPSEPAGGPAAGAAAPAPPAGPPAGDASVARAYLNSSFNDVRDRGKLRQFMLRLGREAPDPAGPRSLAQALGLETPPDAPPAPEPAAAP